MPEAHTQIIVGFDFGSKHIGIAVGQTLTKTAHALTSIPAQKGIPRWETISQIIKTWKPHALVVGIPYNMDGTEQPLTHAARAFIQQLIEHYGLPVHGMDERLSTVEARAALFAKGGYKALKKTAIDSLSAQLILESWLTIYEQ
jgi:putative Holliday junction resolvase